MALEANVKFSVVVLLKKDRELFLVDGEGTDVESVCFEVSEAQLLGKYAGDVRYDDQVMIR